MRKFTFLLILGIILVLLSSCSLERSSMRKYLTQNDQDIANESLDKLLNAIEEKDTDSIKRMFSKKVVNEVTNIDDEIDELLNYYEGKHISYDDWGSVDTSGSFDYGESKVTLDSTYDITTDEEEYRVAIQECIEDTVSSENVGICYIYIIKKKDDVDTQFAYRGDDKETPGININVKNNITDDLY